MRRGYVPPRGALTRTRGRVSAFAFFAAAYAIFSPASAQDIKVARTDGAGVVRLGLQTNENTVSIVSGNLNATYLAIAYDMSAVLDDGERLRILPVVGKGGGQNIRDVRFLKGVDLGITSRTCSISSGAPTRSGRSTTRSSTSPSSSTRKCTSWCAPTPASPRSISSPARR